MNDEVICLEKVWFGYEDVPVLEDVSLSVDRHDFLGIIGPNGGGKTTLLKILLGLLKPDQGTVRVLGKDPAVSRPDIGYVPQQAGFDRDFPISVRDVVMMGRLRHRGLFKKYCREDAEIVREALATVDIADLANRQVGKLSGGQRQRTLIARALVTEPKILLLDEPYASVDVKSQEGLYELLHRLRGKIPVIMVSHDISAVSTHMDKIACLNRKLYYHDSKELAAEDFEKAYGCSIELIAHGVPHRVLKTH